MFPADLRGRSIHEDVPQQVGVLVVVDAATPEFAEAATGKLADALAARTDVIRAVRGGGQAGSFLRQNGSASCDRRGRARRPRAARRRSVLETLADVLMRGSLAALSFGLMGVHAGDEPRRPRPADDPGRDTQR